MTTFDIRKSIENIIDESRNDTLKNLNAIKHIGINTEKNVAILIIEIGKLDPLHVKNLKRALAKAIKLDLGFSGIKVQFTEAKLFNNSFGKDTKFIIVHSNKGGVGKTTVACNLAYALTRLGKKVGIIDADIYGCSVPKFLEIEYSDPIIDSNNKIIPFYKFGIEVISSEFFTDEGKAILWKGSALQNILNNFFFQVKWNKQLDYVVVDCPTGTGDVMLFLNSILNDAEILLVTTPDPISTFVTEKGGKAAIQTKHKIIGIVNNMCYYKHNGEIVNIYKEDNSTALANNLNSEVLINLGHINPIHHNYLFESDEENGKQFDDLANIISIR